MANILHVERAANKITLGTTGTTINIASHTASKLLALDASKDLISTIEPSTDGTLGGNSDLAIPTEKAIKTYVDLAIGSSKDYFLSDNDDPSIANYHILYETDTGEAASTLVTAAMGENDDQLMFSYITPSGVPGVTFLRSGVYVLHTHLARTTGNKPTTTYWTLSKYTTGDVETALITSEVTSEIPATMASFITHGILASDATINNTDRLVLKLYANVGAAGADSVITIYMEGTNDCHLTNLLPSNIWQSQGDVLDDLNTLGVVGADGEFLVGTGAGALAWEGGATARTSLGLVIGTNVQAHHANLASLAGLTYAAASFVKMTGANTFALRTIGETADDLEATIDHDNLANGGAHDYAYISGNDGATGITAAELEELSDGTETTLHNHVASADVKVGIDVGATAGYIGAASNDGVLRTTTGLSYADGGDFVTLGLSHLGFESLTDPDTDRALFWDDSESAIKWLTVVQGVQIYGTKLQFDVNSLTEDTTPATNDYIVTYDVSHATPGYEHKKVLISNLLGSFGQVSISGSTDALDVANANIVFVTTTDADVIIGGLANGVLGQVVHIIKVVVGNMMRIENKEGTGTQQIVTCTNADRDFNDYGGMTVVFNGATWFEVAI